MELRHVRYFIAVAEERSVTRAAERLWIAQPGLSQQLLALERELGVRLLERHSRGVELTDAGRLFLEKARRVLAAAEEALSVAEGASAGLIGHLRLGLSWRARYGLAPALQRAYAADRPGVAVAVTEAQSDSLVRDVRDARLDAAIVLGPQRVDGIEHMLLARRPAGLTMAPRHPLVRREVLAGDDLRGEAFVVSGDRGDETYDRAVAETLRVLGVEPRLQRGGYGFAMLGPVRDGDALMLESQPALAVASGLIWRPLRGAPAFGFELVWSEGARSGALSAFIDLCRRVRDIADPCPAGAGPRRARVRVAA